MIGDNYMFVGLYHTTIVSTLLANQMIAWFVKVNINNLLKKAVLTSYSWLCEDCTVFVHINQ